ncbi:hypothetical protein Y032_0035g3004 [Ancylostoma ceylanicum]|uniref:Uncharacterized protein n=1 Tax=Ancylostoma ceylanicum TaxID=53326 RepID=A0A016ULX7_9BILA|nr:hypothetical protein Y032_0035g3004 [Ancylostoma ceylanicum]
MADHAFRKIDALEEHRFQNTNESLSFLLDFNRKKAEVLEKDKDSLLEHLEAVCAVVPLAAQQRSRIMGEVKEEVVIGYLVNDAVCRSEFAIQDGGRAILEVVLTDGEVRKRCVLHALTNEEYNAGNSAPWRGDRVDLPYYFGELFVVNYGNARDFPEDLARVIP